MEQKSRRRMQALAAHMTNSACSPSVVNTRNTTTPSSALLLGLDPFSWDDAAASVFDRVDLSTLVLDDATEASDDERWTLEEGASSDVEADPTTASPPNGVLDFVPVAGKSGRRSRRPFPGQPGVKSRGQKTPGSLKSSLFDGDGVDIDRSVFQKALMPFTYGGGAPLRPLSAAQVSALAAYLSPTCRDIRKALRAHLMAEKELFHPRWGAKDSLAYTRSRTIKQVTTVNSWRLMNAWDLLHDPIKYITVSEILTQVEAGMATKFGVHYGLFVGALAKLGTDKHHQKYFDDCSSLKVLGCFCMTELGHGSNVRGVETLAVYDAQADAFVINTPHERAQKFWIGGGMAATHTVVFAQLIMPPKGTALPAQLNAQTTSGAGWSNKGVHVFIVPLRDTPYGPTRDGVRTADCGPKMGMDGIDNTRLWFNMVRVPRDNLLNRFADVDDQGNYSSSISSPVALFAKSVGALVGGRVLIAAGAVGLGRSALTTAVKYGYSRTQFSPGPGLAEEPIMKYLTHQMRLFPLVAENFAMSFAMEHLKRLYVAGRPEQTKEVHCYASALKARTTWSLTRALITSRETCGGHGFSAFAGFGAMIANHGIMKTYEGDNTVLMQQTSSILLGEFGAQIRAADFSGMLAFVGSTARRAVRGRNPISRRYTPEFHLRDDAFQIHALEYREASLLRKLAGRMQTARKARQSAAEAWAANLDLVMALGNAHVDRLLLEAMVIGVRDAPNKELARSLDAMRALYGLWLLEQDTFWTAKRYFGARKAEAIHAQIIKLCGELYEVMPQLVDAFDVVPLTLPPQMTQGPEAMVKFWSYDNYNDSNNGLNTAGDVTGLYEAGTGAGGRSSL